jgi:predicted metal-dependent hydrolase
MRLQISSLKGLELIVPRGINSQTILKFLSEHESWISKRAAKPVKDYLLFGKELKIETIDCPLNKKFDFENSGDTLLIKGPFSKRITTKFLYEQWLYFYAKDYLSSRTRELALNSGFRFNKIVVRKQTSRWGSCSAKGNISLNYKLMKHSHEIIDYVIIHELCHLIHMNHSDKFWNLVGKYIPDYKNLRNALKNEI